MADKIYILNIDRMVARQLDFEGLCSEDASIALHKKMQQVASPVNPNFDFPYILLMPSHLRKILNLYEGYGVGLKGFKEFSHEKQSKLLSDFIRQEPKTSNFLYAFNFKDENPIPWEKMFPYLEKEFEVQRADLNLDLREL